MSCDCKLCEFDRASVADFIRKVFDIEYAMVTEESHITDFGWGPEEQERAWQLYNVKLPVKWPQGDGYIWQVMDKIGCKRKEQHG